MKLGIRRISFVAALVALVAAFSAGIVLAQGAPPVGPRHSQMRQNAGGPAGLFQHLNLTDDQKTKIQSLVQAQRQAHQGQAQQMRDLQQQLKNAVFADNGPADTASIQQQITALQGQLEADRVNLEKQIAGVLTPDQRKQVRDMPGPFMGGGRGMAMRHAPGRGPGF